MKLKESWILQVFSIRKNGKNQDFLVNKCVVYFNMRLHFREIFQFQSASDFLLQSLFFVIRLKDITITLKTCKLYRLLNIPAVLANLYSV